MIDDRGVALELPGAPQRIISLVPSTSETLVDIGVGSRLVGVTRYCVEPSWLRERLTVVGGTKKVDLDVIQGLQPDLVIGNREENSESIFSDIEALGIPLYVAAPASIDDALHDLRRMARLVGLAEAGEDRARGIEAARAELAAGARPFDYQYLIWRRRTDGGLRWMAAGGGTFIEAMLAEAGGRNLCAGGESRYPELGIEELAAVGGLVLLSSEPYPFDERHREELISAGIAPQRLRLVDGALCSWHGVRMVQAMPMLSRLHQEEAE